MEQNKSSVPLMPRESAKFISQYSKNVSINEEGVKKLSHMIIEGLKSGEISKENFFNHEFLPKEYDSKVIDWIFVLNTLNFCFWRNKNDNHWEVMGESGYFALCAAIKRGLEEGIPILDPSYYSKITKNELENIFRSDINNVEIPLIDERVQNLQEVGRVLLEKYNGTFLECVKQSNGSALKLLELIVADFVCFRDEGVFRDQKVSFYKRAQIVVADIWACFKGKGLGNFHDIDALTMFADYRVPQVLVYFDAMCYTTSLLNSLQSETELKAGSEEEIEIRGCAVEVVERIVREIKSQLKDSDFNAIQIDFYLWFFRRQHANKLETVPFHKVRTIYY
ncbi:queuosine salvage protein [Leptopilina boulardi]|uniref:queuosine salvage protein n=1 Tax=Leptopilina boulardi TaxID=63433 RepID=UPI0021F56A1A|nr:queuosine salvage protein [Leptopilina boulardi]